MWKYCGKAVEKVVKQVLENYETKVLSATTQIDFIKRLIVYHIIYFEEDDLLWYKR